MSSLESLQSFVTKKFKNFHDDYQLIQKHHKVKRKTCEDENKLV